MRKRDELSDPYSCLSKAKENEHLFVLLGRDAAAPATIRFWVQERVRLGKNTVTDGQMRDACECADAMEAYLGREVNERQRLISEVVRLVREINQYFTDVTYWNTTPPDPDGQIGKMRQALEVLVQEAATWQGPIYPTENHHLACRCANSRSGTTLGTIS